MYEFYLGKKFMSEKTIPLSQSLLYAQDLARLYKIERSKQAELERAFILIRQKNEKLEQEKNQLLSFAEDFRNLYQQLLVSHTKTEKANLETIYRLSIAAEYRDEQTSQHLKRLSRYSRILAEGLGLDKNFVKLIEKASPMHDIGKIGIPDHILLKPGKHTPEEQELMKLHTVYGQKILKNSESEILQMAENIAFTHHEKYDGTGYPRGISGEEIPIEGRIVAIADVFDALTTKRVYKPAFTIEKTLTLMNDMCNSHFDPKIFQVFMNSIEKIRTFMTFEETQETAE